MCIYHKYKIRNHPEFIIVLGKALDRYEDMFGKDPKQHKKGQLIGNSFTVVYPLSLTSSFV